jgi:hypothetical protein
MRTYQIFDVRAGASQVASARCPGDPREEISPQAQRQAAALELCGEEPGMIVKYRLDNLIAMANTKGDA